MGEIRPSHPCFILLLYTLDNRGSFLTLGLPVASRQMAPSRQERRKEERAAAKRAPAQSGAAGASAARTNVHVNPGGDDWKTQEEDPAVGPGGCCYEYCTTLRGAIDRAGSAGATVRTRAR